MANVKIKIVFNKTWLGTLFGALIKGGCPKLSAYISK